MLTKPVSIRAWAPALVHYVTTLELRYPGSSFAGMDCGTDFLLGLPGLRPEFPPTQGSEQGLSILLF
jgi:hypothetical protein